MKLIMIRVGNSQKRASVRKGTIGTTSKRRTDNKLSNCLDGLSLQQVIQPSRKVQCKTKSVTRLKKKNLKLKLSRVIQKMKKWKTFSKSHFLKMNNQISQILSLSKAYLLTSFMVSKKAKINNKMIRKSLKIKNCWKKMKKRNRSRVN